MKLIPALESLASVEDVTIYIEPLQQKGVPANLFHQHLTQSTDEIRDNDQSFSDIPLINNPHRGNFNSPIGADGKHFEFDEGEED